MITFGGNDNNDLYIGADGNLVMLSEVDACADCCSTAVKAQRNEMIYDMDNGMPTRQTAWDDFNPAQFEAAARAIILGITGVTDIQSFVITVTANELSYTAEILTIYSSNSVVING
jgi:hypothetical protein